MVLFHACDCGYPFWPFVEDCFASGNSFRPFIKHGLFINMWINYWGVWFVPLVPKSVYVWQPLCFDFNYLIVCFEICYCDASSFCFRCFKISLTTWSLFWFHITFRVVFPRPEKNTSNILIGIALNLQTNLAGVGILMILILTHECDYMNV